ncbi:hypothetical protein D9619_013182 [Psilocybe cf. subviscida]|uniref:WSC domain-containing protein n=1 Tax=Psilocybe cf. subviscida TaxID=2480587 RepID=A0A8H5EZ35_9AGAR|nr:hypothetical protein D9619_013182 [Psilocybe cf. subviscida]
MYLFTPVFQCKDLLLTVFAALVVPGYAQRTPADPFNDKSLSATNLTSPLPPGWNQFFCWEDCGLLFGPVFSDSVHLTIESCVEFCDGQGLRIAGLEGNDCRCGNIFNPFACHETNPGACEDPEQVALGCPGNREESCGNSGLAGGIQLLNLFFKQSFTQYSCFPRVEWPGGAALTAIGSWRFSNYYE